MRGVWKRYEAGPVEAQLLGWVTLALVHAAVLGATLSVRPALQWAVHLYAFGQFMALALAGVGLSLLWKRFGPKRVSLQVGLCVLAASVSLRYLLEEDLSGPAGRLSIDTGLRISPEAFIWLAGGLVGLGGVAAVWVGRWIARPWLRWGGIAVACAAGAGNALLFPEGYVGLHLVAACGAAVFCGACYLGIRLPVRVPMVPYVLGGAFVLTLPAVLHRPSNAVLLQLIKQPAAVLAPYASKLGGASKIDAQIPPHQKQWFEDRTHLPPVEPSAPPLLPENPIIVMIGIDALRADVLADESRRQLLPELFRLRDESVWFTTARGTGSSTVISLASVFSGLHYSQLYWDKHPKHRHFVFPHKDPSPRLAELLSDAGFYTFNVDAMSQLRNEFGVVRGFQKEVFVKKGPGKWGYKPAPVVTRALFGALRKRPPGAMFAFTHLLDTHAPYLGDGETPFEKYLDEATIVDEQIGELRSLLAEEDIADRTILILFADHGEAFGEHGLEHHAVSLYEVMVRVPLLIHVPGVRPRAVDTPVSLIDVAPTVLDLVGLPTPARMMGESLVPFLRGETPKLTRPIVLEGRLKRALIDERGRKIIHDPRLQTLELYDLNQDPGELQNLCEDLSQECSELRAVVSAFFDAHTYKAPGYEVPYRKW